MSEPITATEVMQRLKEQDELISKIYEESLDKYVRELRDAKIAYLKMKFNDKVDCEKLHDLLQRMFYERLAFGVSDVKEEDVLACIRNDATVNK